MASEVLWVVPVALVPGTSLSQELVSGQAPPDSSVMLSFSYGGKTPKKAFSKLP